MEHKKVIFGCMLSGVTIAVSLSVSTQDFLNLLSHMFSYKEIFKVFKSDI